MTCDTTPRVIGMDTATKTTARVGTMKSAHTREGIMVTISRRCICTLLIAPATTLLTFGSMCRAQQVSPSISSNLEQTAGTTSTRRSLSQSAGPSILPDDFAKLRLDIGYQLELEVFG